MGGGEETRRQGDKETRTGTLTVTLDPGTGVGPCVLLLGSDAVITVHVSADVPEDHVEDEEDGEDKERHEDSLGHRRDERLHLSGEPAAVRRAGGSSYSPLALLATVELNGALRRLTAPRHTHI